MNIYLFLDIVAWGLLALIGALYTLWGLQFWASNHPAKRINLGYTPLIIIVCVAWLVAS